jgi:toxin-antitoxin system PIN domain toxin
VLIDANLLLYAADENSRFHDAASAWLERALAGDRRVGLPWQTLGAFVRVATHPRIYHEPLSPEQAWGYVRRWLAAEPVWIPPATGRTVSVLLDLAEQVPIAVNLVPDAQLAALAIEHGLVVHTADTDFGRFPGVRWVNPLAA